MLILLGYLLGLVLLSWLLRKRSVRLRSFLIVGYNYLFIIPLYFFARLPADATVPAALNLLLRCAYEAPKAMTFGADLTLYDDPAVTLLFYIMSVYTVRTVLVLFFHRAVAAVANWLQMQGRREIFVVCGGLEDARSMIREIRERDRRAAIAFVPQKEADEGADVKAMVMTRPWDQFLRRGKKYHIILLPDAGNNNLCRLDELDRLGEKLPGLRVTAFLDSDVLRYEDLSYPHLDVYLVSREQQLIRGFLQDHLPLRALKERAPGEMAEGVYRPARPFSLCILGFGALSREFLLSTWENTAFMTGAPDGRGLDALIVDGDLAGRRASFLLDVPQLRQEPSFTWLDAAPDSEACAQAIAERLEQLDQILIATEDTRFNLDMAMRLLRMFRRHGMEQEHPQLVIALFEKMDSGIEFLYKKAGGVFLQSNSDQFTYDELILRQTDRRAEALNRQYNRKSLYATDWNRLGTFRQDSNRAVVWDIPNKLLLAGDMEGLSPEARQAVYWQLARYEHRRWCVFQYTHGWTVLPREELTAEEIRGCVTKRAAQKRHACLVPWDELDALPQSSPGLLKEYDRENVLQLFEPETSR